MTHYSSQWTRRTFLQSAGALSALVALGPVKFPTSAHPAASWMTERVDRGTKPAVALTSAGLPRIAYMLERKSGWVKAARRDDGDWKASTAAEGYFYGPLDIGIDSQRQTHIVYHDHQASSFDPGLGDAALAVHRDDGWELMALSHPGHDGWDVRMTIDADDVVHVSALDPQQFTGNGVEYYRVQPSGQLLVETVGTDALPYQWATSIALAPDGTPHISYYHFDSSSLRLAIRTGENEWRIEAVDDNDDTGAFSSIAIDGEGGTHISYFETSRPVAFSEEGVVKYAFRGAGDSEWQITEVDPLKDFVPGFYSARNITSLALDTQDNPQIVYSDESVMRRARWIDGEWRTETIVEISDDADPLGQIVSLKLDADDVPHVAYAITTQKDPLDGEIRYATLKG